MTRLLDIYVITISLGLGLIKFGLWCLKDYLRVIRLEMIEKAARERTTPVRATLRVTTWSRGVVRTYPQYVSRSGTQLGVRLECGAAVQICCVVLCCTALRCVAYLGMFYLYLLCARVTEIRCCSCFERCCVWLLLPDEMILLLDEFMQTPVEGLMPYRGKGSQGWHICGWWRILSYSIV